MDIDRKGLLLVLATAIISGVSIFANGWAVKGFDSSVFTFSKNVLVAVFLGATILLLGKYKELLRLSKKEWLSLAGIGLIGGAIPFLLFFAGLQAAGASTGQFIHKTLFLFASVTALFFLKERLNTGFVVGAILLLAGNFVLLRPDITWSLAFFLVLGATVFWAAENVWAKRLLQSVSGTVVAWGRMFFGSIFLLSYLFFTGKASLITSMTGTQYLWILVTGAFLFGYVFTYYHGLARVPVSVATSVLAIAVPVTTLLKYVFADTVVSVSVVIGLGLLVSGVASMLYLSSLITHVKAWYTGYFLDGRR